MSEQELKPCPFEKVVKDIGHQVYFDRELMQVTCSCGARGPIMDYTQEIAMVGWNARHEAPLDNGLTVEQKSLDVWEIFDILHDSVLPWQDRTYSEQGFKTMADAMFAAIPTESEKDVRIKICQKKIEELENQLSYYAELEASICPEDYGFDEVIKSLTAQIKEMREVLRRSSEYKTFNFRVEARNVLAKYPEAK